MQAWAAWQALKWHFGIVAGLMLEAASALKPKSVSSTYREMRVMQMRAELPEWLGGYRR